jgi:hypothetical protein
LDATIRLLTPGLCVQASWRCTEAGRRLRLRVGDDAHTPFEKQMISFFRHDLIGLALVDEDGQEFKAGRIDYLRDACSTFVLENVVLLLGRKRGQLPQ